MRTIRHELKQRSCKGEKSCKYKRLSSDIYVFEDQHEPGWLKVGYTIYQNAEDRVREQFNTRLQLDANPYILHHVEDAIDNYDEPFMDHDVHTVLVSKGINEVHPPTATKAVEVGELHYNKVCYVK